MKIGIMLFKLSIFQSLFSALLVLYFTSSQSQEECSQIHRTITLKFFTLVYLMLLVNCFLCKLYSMFFFFFLWGPLGFQTFFLSTDNRCSPVTRDICFSKSEVLYLPAQPPLLNATLPFPSSFGQYSLLSSIYTPGMRQS